MKCIGALSNVLARHVSKQSFTATYYGKQVAFLEHCVSIDNHKGEKSKIINGTVRLDALDKKEQMRSRSNCIYILK